MPKVRVLVVDDSPTIRQQLTMTFADAGYAVEVAVDGQDGLERLRVLGQREVGVLRADLREARGRPAGPAAARPMPDANPRRDG